MAYSELIKNFLKCAAICGSWLKTRLSDPQIALFQISTACLQDIEPLFLMDDFVFFDCYADGDPFSDNAYIDHFSVILKAFYKKRRLYIDYRNRNGQLIQDETEMLIRILSFGPMLRVISPNRFKKYIKNWFTMQQAIKE